MDVYSVHREQIASIVVHRRSLNSGVILSCKTAFKAVLCNPDSQNLGAQN